MTRFDLSTVRKCGRPTRAGTPCQRPALHDREACARHGGRTPTGWANPNYRHGRYSQHMPPALVDAYDRSRQDPDILQLRDELGLVDARLGSLLDSAAQRAPDWAALQAQWDAIEAAQVAGDQPAAARALAGLRETIRNAAGLPVVWPEIYEALDLRRRLADSERRRLEALRAAISADEVMLLIGRLAVSVRTHVSDVAALRAISAEFEAALPTGARRAAAG